MGFDSNLEVQVASSGWSLWPLKKSEIKINADNQLAYAAQAQCRFTIKPTVMDKASTRVGNKVILALRIMGKKRLPKFQACLFARNRGKKQ